MNQLHLVEKLFHLLCCPPLPFRLARICQWREEGKYIGPCPLLLPTPSRDFLCLTSGFIHRPLPSQSEHVYSMIHGAMVPSYSLFLLQQEPFNEYSQKWETGCPFLMAFQLWLCTFNLKIEPIFLRLQMR